MKAVVVLKLPKPAGTVLAIARSIVDFMTENPHFPSPNPPLSTISLAIAEAAAAEAEVLTRAKGTKPARDAKLDELRSQLDRLKAYVQAVADDSTTEALSIIEGAGMHVKRPSIRNKQPFTAVCGPVSGTAKLRAKWAGDRARYEWWWGTDPNELALLRTTIQAETDVSGLTPLTLYYFQVRILRPDGSIELRDVVSLAVT